MKKLYEQSGTLLENLSEMFDNAVNYGSIYTVERGIIGDRETKYLTYLQEDKYPCEVNVFSNTNENLEPIFFVSVEDGGDSAEVYFTTDRAEAISFADSLEYDSDDTIEREIEKFEKAFPYECDVTVSRKYQDGDFYIYEVTAINPRKTDEAYQVEVRNLDVEDVVYYLNKQVILNLFLEGDKGDFEAFVADESNYSELLF